MFVKLLLFSIKPYINILYNINKTGKFASLPKRLQTLNFIATRSINYTNHKKIDMPRAGGTIATLSTEKKMFRNEIQRNNNRF